MFIYALTTFLSAFLLFEVQPLIAKVVLPWFGGSPSVWTTCMLFFQTLLLAGYAYAHLLTSRLSPRNQGYVHSVLLMAAMVALPITPNERFELVSRSEPVQQLLMLLTRSVGLPFLVLSSTAPLIQHWFAMREPNASPYRLYALSNFASLLALLSYPFIIEPNLVLVTQTKFWDAGFLIFVILCGFCALRAARNTNQSAASSSIFPVHTNSTGVPQLRDYLVWIILPALATLMLLAVTNHLCHNVAVVPYLWIMPLSAYLLSFVICFDHPRWYRRWPFAVAFLLTLGLLCYALYLGTDISLPRQVGVYVAALFVLCMICHGELYARRPSPTHLTKYYLLIAFGGALGGVAVSIVAPMIFKYYLEFQFGLLLCCAVFLALYLKAARPSLKRPLFWLASLVALCVLGGLAGFLRWHYQREYAEEFGQKRNFYGAISLYDSTADIVLPTSNEEGEATKPTTVKYRKLLHGAIAHGLQFMDHAIERWPTTYYAKYSGIDLAIRALQERGPLRVGAVGLGAGTIATFGRSNDYFRFYEINPAVSKVAYDSFTFLRSSPAKIMVILGDARISLKREKPQNFNLLVLDAFTGDAIPTHLLTKEAFESYLRHLQPDGVIAVHISNRFLNLSPLIRKMAEHLQMKVVQINYDDNTDKVRWWRYSSDWLLLSRDKSLLETPLIQEHAIELKPLGKVRLWTDNYVALFDVLDTSS